jgi:hypothetical protein
MKNGKDRVERFLDKNAAEQLAKVDWDRLTNEISARLDHARQAESVPYRRPVIFKIAAGVAVAAVVFVAVMLGMHELSDLQTPRGKSAVVKSVDEQGAISFQIKDADGRIVAMVQDGRTDKGRVKCDVEIIDRNDDSQADSRQAAWIIISAPTRTLEEDGYNREEADLMCLL